MTMPMLDGKPDWPAFFAGDYEVDVEVIEMARFYSTSPIGCYHVQLVESSFDDELDVLEHAFFNSAKEYDKLRMEKLHDLIRDYVV